MTVPYLPSGRASLAVALVLLLNLLLPGALAAQDDSPVTPKILFVVTSHGQIGDTGASTGYYLSEVAHPWKVLTEAGYEIDFVSPQGGEPPVDGKDLDDPVNAEFWNDPVYRGKMAHTLRPEEVDPGAYVAIHYAGGHGTMWDFPENDAIAGLAREIYESDGVVSAVCHGPAGLLNVRLSDGSYLIDGKRVNGFTNEEETARGLAEEVPFLLEDALKDRGAQFEQSAKWQEHITVDGRLVTGQNPASAHGVGEAVLELVGKPEQRK